MRKGYSKSHKDPKVAHGVVISPLTCNSTAEYSTVNRTVEGSNPSMSAERARVTELLSPFLMSQDRPRDGANVNITKCDYDHRKLITE